MLTKDSHEERKQAAYSFLKKLEHVLNQSLPSPAQLRSQIRNTVAGAKKDKAQDHLRLPESAFVNLFAIPILSKLIREQDGMNAETATQSLLSEYTKMRPQYCSGTPSRRERHPFKKIMGLKPPEIMHQWMSGRDNALTQSCPDLATRAPFPLKIVFEAKYFENGGEKRATTDLVNSIYQTFFYRGLPYVPSRSGSAAWDYEFACMLAGDASEGAALKRTWEAIPKSVKRGFWEGANIYVLIVRGLAAN